MGVQDVEKIGSPGELGKSEDVGGFKEAEIDREDNREEVANEIKRTGDCELIFLNFKICYILLLPSAARTSTLSQMNPL